MKNCFFVAILTVFSLTGLYASAPEKVVGHCPKKVYVEKSAVRIVKNGFKITTESGTIKTKTLRSDKSGLYFLKEDIRGNPVRCCPQIRFLCDTCQKGFRTEKDVKLHLEETGHEGFHRFPPPNWRF